MEQIMSAKPLAEAFEKLKVLRRQGRLDSETQSRVGHQLSATRQDVLDHVIALIRKFNVPGEASTGADESTNLVRVLDIRTLADRVFGDEKKAEAWLHRPNTSLSGQKPIDLLKDELGAAVVREILEQIDSGIFA
jgi:uncharacterized protein (DUF2384 family)